ncbi:FAD/NAD(P)-binding protein [Streptomyces sp. CAU 1734]|uniref:FAD/NAD(P)-binding protein n=1 Tax=Streptomyces sp. CAU 1734 TaxID=3140360 RepID=UPI00326098C6
MSSKPIGIAIIGAGPRGLSVLERLCANERHAPAGPPLTVHLVDPAEPGAGAVWRPDQSRHLLMNTVASQITLYTDASVRIDGPVEPGPSLHEWARRLARGTDTAGHDDGTLAEARDLGPNDYPTRAFYGRYLKDCLGRVLASIPAHITVRVHRTRAVALADTPGTPDGPQRVRLADGTELDHLAGVVLAQGHVPSDPLPAERELALHAEKADLAYYPPGNPADLDLSGIAPGENVLLRGLGLNFFDHMTLLTSGRGGTFERSGGRLVYRASGQEPRLWATSRRGIPYHARGENEKGVDGRHHPRLLTTAFVAALRGRVAAGWPVDFRAELWPLIAREVESVHYGTLLDTLGRAAEREEFTARYLTAAGELEPLLDAYAIDPADRWDWDLLNRPYRDIEFTDRAHFRGWLLDYLARDIELARAGNLSGPVKAALDVLRDLRNEIRVAVDHSGLRPNSHRDHLERWYTPLNAFLSIGPPASRIEEMSALIEAGVLDLTGPATDIRVDPEHHVYVAQSTAVPGPPLHATVLIEARLPEPDVRRTQDPLIRTLLAEGQAAAYRVGGDGAYQTGGLAVGARPYRLLNAGGREHPRRHAYGVPTESVHWVTAAGIRPGVDSVTLGDSDSIARALLALAATDADVSAADTGGIPALHAAAGAPARQWSPPPGREKAGHE